MYYEDSEVPARDEARRRILSEAGVGSRGCMSKPRIWGLVIGLTVVIAAIILIAVLVTLPSKGKNAAQVQKLIAASQTALDGFNRLGYDRKPLL